MKRFLINNPIIATFIAAALFCALLMGVMWLRRDVYFTPFEVRCAQALATEHGAVGVDRGAITIIGKNGGYLRTQLTPKRARIVARDLEAWATDAGSPTCHCDGDDCDCEPPQ